MPRLLSAVIAGCLLAAGPAPAQPIAIPPPVESGRRADGRNVVAGPQILIPAAGDPRLLNMADKMRHSPSGFACPQTFDGLPVLLMVVDPRADSLSCSYRAGTELRYRQDDTIRYQIKLVKASPSDTPRSVFDRLTAAGRASLLILGDHAPPLAPGPAPAPEFVAYWDTEDAGVQGAWVAKAGRWIVWLRAQYPPSAANDDEAGRVAKILFDQVSREAK